MTLASSDKFMKLSYHKKVDERLRPIIMQLACHLFIKLNNSLILNKLNIKSKLSNSRFSLAGVFQLAATAKTVAKKRQDKAPIKYSFKNKKINVSFWRHE
ncbi:hypothetical protein [Plesiomonas shigelloides]